MKNVREHIQKNPILYRLIIGSIGMTAITVFLLTVLFSRSAEQQMREEILRSQQMNLQRVASIVDFRAEYANYLMQAVNRDKSISQLFYSMEGKDSLTALRALSEMRQSVKQLHSIYIYNEYEDLIYSSTGLAAYSVREKQTFIDQDFIGILENIDRYPKYSPILRRVSEEKPNGQLVEEYVYTYLLYDSYSSGSIKNILALNFHLGWMGEALSYISSESGRESTVWVVDRNREIVYADNSMLIGTEAAEERFPDAIFRNASGYMMTQDGQNREMLVYATPNRAGYDQWTFVSVSNYSEMIKPFTRLRSIIYYIAAAVILLSLGGTAFFSRSVYRPVKEVIDTAESLRLDQEKKKELERTLYLRRLFQGDLSEEPSKIKEQLQEIGLEYNIDRENRLALISVDYLNSYLIQFKNNLENTEQFIGETIRQSIAENYHEFILLKMRDGLWCVCVLAEISVRMHRLQRVFDQINSRLMEQYGLSVSIAVSSMGHSAGDIPFLYAEASNNLSYRFLLGQNRIFNPEEMDEYGKEKFAYPLETEEKMVSSIFSGKPQEAEAYYERFVDQIRFYPISDIKISFVLLANAIKRASSNTITEVSGIMMEFDHFHHKLQELETLDEVNQMFHHLIQEITEKAQRYTQKKYEQLIQQVKDFVAENYGSIALSMNDVADHVDMSAAYLGRLFKQLTGVTFSEYLTKFRLDTACDMLLNTGKTVNEISDAVGFTNSSYFYIVFKKNLGCTPNQYRKQSEA